ncbi:hypothetical protein SD71_13815 [Cohnella kolymensis]|uniref:Uncharacterized protein n=1 Tax=Cohnella kolymensis TaxID=1590652 RepID=A0ABR5A2U8_9BACL|nr:hypothetical protein [Cohnella kolymensis]KIL35387.1 hypothetical protein SD71_13815 [Cohnella kolymensis]
MTKPRRKRPKLQNRYLLMSALLVMGVFTVLYIDIRSTSEMLVSQDPESTSTSEVTPQNVPSNNASSDPPQTSKSLEQHDHPTMATRFTESPTSDDTPNSYSKQEPIFTENQTSAKSEIDNLYESEINWLRSECQSKSNQLLQKMINEVKSNEEVTIKTLQSKFLGQLLIAEAGCDGSFQTILNKATADYQEAGIPVTDMPAWKSQYQKEKAAVRASAIAQLASAIK